MCNLTHSHVKKYVIAKAAKAARSMQSLDYKGVFRHMSNFEYLSVRVSTVSRISRNRFRVLVSRLGLGLVIVVG